MKKHVESGGPVNKPTNNGAFGEAKFTIAELSELFEISRSTLYQFDKDEIIVGQLVPSGTTQKKLYGWVDVEKLARKLREKIKSPKENKVKVFANLKGGVGKSSLASQFAMRASSGGLKTLLVDLDPQAHATLAVGYEIDDDTPTIMEAMINKVPLSAIIKHVTPLLGLIPASLGLSALEMRLFQMSKREQRLSELFREIRSEWDLIVVDTNPSASIVNVNAILAADELCIVTATDFLSVTGLKKLFSILKELEEDFDTVPNVRIIPNLFDVRDGIAQESLGLLRQHYGRFLTNTVVRKNTDIKEAQKAAQSICQYSRKSTGAEDVSSLTNELLREITA